MQKNYPELVTAKMAKEYRQGRVFINWEQNDSKKTMICVYSLRAREKPFVSFPLTWPELEQLAGQGDPEKLQIIYAEAIHRVEKQGDLFQEVLVKQQKLPHLMKRVFGYRLTSELSRVALARSARSLRLANRSRWRDFYQGAEGIIDCFLGREGLGDIGAEEHQIGPFLI